MMSGLALHSVFAGLLLEGEESGWVQLLVFAVMGAIYVLGSLVKAKKQKHDLQEEQGGTQPAGKPLRAQGPSRGVQEGQAAGQAVRPAGGGQAQPEAPDRPRSRTIIRPGSALAAFVSEIKAELTRTAGALQEGRFPPQRPAAAPQTKQPPIVATQPAEIVSAKPIALGAKPKAAVDDLAEILPEFSGPDDLRRAILYYEVLGKAVALRAPGEHLIGL